MTSSAGRHRPMGSLADRPPHETATRNPDGRTTLDRHPSAGRRRRTGIVPLAARSRVRHAACRAIVAEGQALSYAQLGEMVARERARLDAAGARPSDRIAIAATRSIETIVAILACVDAGVGYVPLDLSYPAERLAAMIDASRPRLVMGDDAALEKLRASVPEFPTLERPAAREAVHAAESDWPMCSSRRARPAPPRAWPWAHCRCAT
ncbi:amino acid adenylation domain-containing protein [Piscinibacter aquaticus]|uniref:Amino acid adenylation domain-containing protein n=1 Tax=Piscinibacter aquaticus TaxID=392597 RepID=A0A5C6U1J1_9BURK|nr:amino acid adenylation domain-containing protein [Piscinibacter aquaticus]